MSGYPTQAQFAAALGTRFSAPGRPLGDEPPADSQPVPVAEFELTKLTPGIESGGYAPFSLEFECEASLPQGTYELAHDSLGTHAVFLVPIASDGASTRYEAVFNVEKGSEG